MPNEKNSTNNTVYVLLFIIVIGVTVTAGSTLTAAILYHKKNKNLLSGNSKKQSGSKPISVNIDEIDTKKIKKLCSAEVNACGKGSSCRDTFAEHASKHPDVPLFCHKYEDKNAQALVDCYLKNYSKVHASGNDKPSATFCINKQNSKTQLSKNDAKRLINDAESI